MSQDPIPNGVQKDTILTWTNENKFKIVLVGDSGVGKTSIFWQYIEEIFPDDVSELKVNALQYKFYENLISSSILMETHYYFDSGYNVIDNELIKLYIWDTAGQERYRALVSNYFKGTQGILLIFDLSSAESFESIKNSWYQLGKEKSGDASFILVGNKSDLQVRKVDPLKIEQFTQQNNLPYFEVSAFNGTNINQAFDRIACDIKAKIPKKESSKPSHESIPNERAITQIQEKSEAKQSIILKSTLKTKEDSNKNKKECC